ncbi:sensor histidine kinase [Acanthopleuribacter pedis]|uniref:Histidine kinase n=1 Tax=Acanthopleuribacter pedis TaxID=442870 RepID=A0A8J7U5V0_9BACT|nr:histidine kinase [Acanthopleuribacter pedis]MBO1322097.1 histidine kinase [Acanthopleuribacter pedis]
MARARLFLTVLLLTTCTGLISFGSVAFLFRAEETQVPLYKPLIWELTSAYTLLLLLPLIWWFFSRFKLERGKFAAAVPAHLLGLLTFSGLHTAGMVALRKVIYALLGLEPYEYGSPLNRALMELYKDTFTYIAVILIFSAAAWWRNSRDAELRSVRLQADLREVQLQALRAQLDPHFLFNALNAVSDVMYEDVDRADQILSSLSRLLRFSMDARGATAHPLRRELALLGLYLDVMRARFPDRLRVTVDADPAAADHAVPVLLLQPLVENCIKHHPRAAGQTMEIEVTAKRTGERLEVTVTDNGSGPDKPLAELRRQGVGLENTLRRLETFYGDAAQFQLEKTPAGGAARLVIPPQPRHKEEEHNANPDR